MDNEKFASCVYIILKKMVKFYCKEEMGRFNIMDF